MYQKYRSTQSTCLLCFESLENKGNFINNILLEDGLCSECRINMKSEVHSFRLKGTKVTSLYIYKNEVRNNILRYKESKDIVLAKIFIHPYWGWRFRNYTIVYVPSTSQADRKRGFSHMNEILLASNFNKISSCLSHSGKQEQAMVPYSEKFKVASLIKIEALDSIRNQKVLLVDDILTSGETMSACIRILKPHVKALRCLVIASSPKWYKKTSSCKNN